MLSGIFTGYLDGKILLMELGLLYLDLGFINEDSIR
jgi:hypothetical protein